ncbi:hypothetical protein [Hyphococcus sp.]|uniref:hypothetical protein n=1 Tax=Hyphococcus sp. TaxID=2038636 RepID=UPI003CCC1A32
MTTITFEREYNAANCVRSLISVTEALSDLIARENSALNAGRAEEIRPYQAEKARLAASHARSIKTLSANRAAFCAVEESLLIELRTLTTDFETRLEEQQALMENPADATA